MKIDNPTFDIHITNEDPQQDAVVIAFRRFKKQVINKKSNEGKSVKNVSLALHSPTNEFITRLKNDENILDDFIENDNDIELDLIGKKLEKLIPSF